MKKFDVVILGAGSAGLAARSEVSKVTDNYLVVDQGPLGTTCARDGCMPSKALIEAANAIHRRHLLSAIGVGGVNELRIDAESILSHVRELRDKFVGHVIADMEEWQEHFCKGAARFLDGETIRVGGQDIGFKRAIIATGSSPVVPGAWHEVAEWTVDTDSIFDERTLPDRTAVVGLGPVGLELGQALARLGVQTTGFDPSTSFGGLTSDALQKVAAEFLQEEFDIRYTTAEPETGEPGDSPPRELGVRAGEASIKVDKALLALGRAPNLKAIDPENAGVEIGERGLPDIEPTTMRIKDTKIYIAGDVSGSRPVLHEAVDEGRIAGYNAARGVDRSFQRKTPLLITFTDPNIALAGATRKELDEGNADFVVGEVDFSRQGRAILKQKARGAGEIYLDRSTGKILGAELIAPGGEHLAHFVAFAISNGAAAEDLLAAPFYHPVLEEGLRTALKRGASELKRATSAITLMRCEEPPVGDLPD